MATVDSQYLSKGILVLASSLVFGYGADYFFNLMLGQALSAHDYGDYKVAYSFASICGIIVLLGGDRMAPKLLSYAIQQGQTGLVWKYLTFYGKIALSLSIIIGLTTLLLSYLHLGITDSEDHHPLTIMSVVIPIIAFGALFSRILQSAKQLSLANLPWRIVLPTAKGAAILLAIYFSPQLATWQVIAMGAIIALTIAIWQAIKVFQLGLISTAPSSADFDRSSTLKLSIPMMLAVLITLALGQMDLFMLELMGDESEVGYFAAAATIANILPVAQTTIMGLFLPLIQPALEQGRDASKQLFYFAVKIITPTILLILLLLSVFSSNLLSLFGEAFSSAETVLIILIVAQALWGVVAPCSTWLQYLGEGKRVVQLGVFALLVNVGLNYYLIPIYGMEGAAYSTFASLSSAGLALLYSFKRIQSR